MSRRAFSIVYEFALLIIGAFIAAIAVIVFEAPFNIAPGGVSGLAIIANYLFDFPIGVFILLGNIPIQIVAYRMLGGWRVVAKTVFVVVIYSFMIEALTPFFPPEGVSQNILLNALFAGIATGIGSGLIVRGGGTLGGTSTLGVVLQVRYGIPLGSSALYLEALVVGLAGLVFGWEGALYAIIALYGAGVVSDYVLEGPSVIRTATIITNRPKEVANAILQGMGRGVTAWDGVGMFTEQPRSVLFVTVGRGQIETLRTLVLVTDPTAFLVIGQGHTAFGRGFREVRAGASSQGLEIPGGK